MSLPQDPVEARLPKPAPTTPAQNAAATRTVLRGIDRGVHDAAGARRVLEALGLLPPPLQVPKKRRKK